MSKLNCWAVFDSEGPFTTTIASRRGGAKAAWILQKLASCQCDSAEETWAKDKKLWGLKIKRVEVRW